MKISIRSAAPLLLCLLLLGGAAPAKTAADTARKQYVCAPCGMDCDKGVYDKPGTCPVCGSPLVEKGEAAAMTSAQPKVAILVFNGVEIIDYTGPYEIFGAAGFDVFTVAATREPVSTAFGMKVVPKFTFADAPHADILLVPGGGVKGPRESAPTLEWIRKTSAGAKQTLSVCNGAFILASAGLLDGLTATTTAPRISELAEAYPKIKVAYDQRYVDNGKIITAGGLTSGIDGALHVVSKLLGPATAQQVALVEEYDWHETGGFVRAALADMLIPKIDLSKMGTWEVSRTEGGIDNWEIAAHGTSDLSADELLDRIGQELATKGHWSGVGAESDKTATSSEPATARSGRWTFHGRDGKPWSATLRVEPPAGAGHEYTTKLTITREPAHNG